MVDQDTAPKELFYTEGPDALRAARLQVATPRCPAHPVSPGMRGCARSPLPLRRRLVLPGCRSEGLLCTSQRH